MDWIELARNTDRWDVRLWTESSWLSVRTGGMCGYGLDRTACRYGQVGCVVMNWMEMVEFTDR